MIAARIRAGAKLPGFAQGGDAINGEFVNQMQQHARGGPRISGSAVPLSYLKSKMIR
jgi:hypothetical protein